MAEDKNDFDNFGIGIEDEYADEEDFENFDDDEEYDDGTSSSDDGVDATEEYEDEDFGDEDLDDEEYDIPSESPESVVSSESVVSQPVTPVESSVSEMATEKTDNGVSSVAGTKEDFLEKYKKMRGTLRSRALSSLKARSVMSGSNALNSDLEKELLGYTGLVYKNFDKNLNMPQLKEPVDTFEFKVCEFLVLSAIDALFSMLPLDFNIDESLGLGKEFGFKNSFDFVKSVCQFNKKSSPDAIKATQSRLDAMERGCDVGTYFSDKYYLKDIGRVEYILDIGFDFVRKDSIDDDVKRAISRVFGSMCNAEVSVIIDLYEKMIAASYGLKKYCGVFTFDSTCPVMGLSADNYCPVKVEPAVTFDTVYADVLRGYVSEYVITPDMALNSGNGYDDRQFDVQFIYKTFKNNGGSSDCKAIYFPRKVLEIISTAQLTSSSNRLVYADCIPDERGIKANRSLATYSKYLKGWFTEEIFNYCILACRDYCNNDFSQIVSILNNKSAEQKEFISYISNALRYYTKCVTTAVILTNLETFEVEDEFMHIKDLKILDWRIKVCIPSGRGISNKEFCRKIGSELMGGTAETTYMQDAVDVKVQYDNDNRGISISDLTYTFDANKVFARPVFAHKAFDALKRQGVSLGWDRILLGKYDDGSMCTSEAGGKINIMQNNIHFVIAGSRSGKGVMCYNLFATALASGKPIFYMDRKPDTAVVMKKMSKDVIASMGGAEAAKQQGCYEMFAVNGGIADPKYDTEGVFVEMAKKIKKPSYLTWNDETMGDVVYLRGFLLVLCAYLFADTCKDSEPAKKIANLLSAGAIIVLDEFTNFEKMFLTKFNPSNMFSKCVSDVSINKFEAKKGKVATSGFSVEGLYLTEFLEAFLEVVSEMGSKFRAGGELIKQLQIFVIGQEFPMALDGKDIIERYDTSGASGKRYNTSKLTPFYKILDSGSKDYFFGAQAVEIPGQKPEYFAIQDKGSISGNYLNTSRRCFAYFNHKDFKSSVTNVEMVTDTSNYFKHDLDKINEFFKENMTVFKPFLILNNAVEPPDDLKNPPEGFKYGVNKVDSSLANKRNKGNYQYVGQCLTTCNNAGLSWDDLLNDNNDGSGKLDSRIGFQGYIQDMSGGEYNELVKKLGFSTQILEILVKEVFGYEGSVEEFVCDLRPEAIFSPSIFKKCAEGHKSVQERLNYFFRKPLLGSDENSFSVVCADELGDFAKYYQGTDDGADEVSSDGEDYSDKGEEKFDKVETPISSGDDISSLGVAVSSSGTAGAGTAGVGTEDKAPANGVSPEKFREMYTQMAMSMMTQYLNTHPDLNKDKFNIAMQKYIDKVVAMYTQMVMR